MPPVKRKSASPKRKLTVWNRFVKEHAGEGKDLKQLSRMFKKSPAAKRKSCEIKCAAAHPLRKSASPKRKSPKKRSASASPKKRKSPKRKSASPKRKSPKRKSASPKRKRTRSPSPKGVLLRDASPRALKALAKKASPRKKARLSPLQKEHNAVVKAYFKKHKGEGTPQQLMERANAEYVAMRD